MNFTSILSPLRTQQGAAVSSKKRLLELVAEITSSADSRFNSDELFNQLLARERLGSTGLGKGVAIPHCRSSQCDSITGVLISLEKGIDFEAIDDQVVDLVFALIVPEQAHGEHLKVLAALAEAFENASFRNELRKAEDDQGLYEVAIKGLE
ncbi:PTS sugar transporter subunit IIA [Spongiibacter sp. KMU-158]|uniref:PTS sugar transporter subunit IIA n=1 Tax=Spongiibacter pelagi TaxID=2760804 RepID=A0A927C473_9GAMM|nr:PTS sugar transporter subunit IIA [Spongiibacter pelagi]MBD2859702.1 PTS sugar transporter subunit IIA [Spongiibacter pelagi]